MFAAGCGDGNGRANFCHLSSLRHMKSFRESFIGGPAIKPETSADYSQLIGPTRPQRWKGSVASSFHERCFMGVIGRGRRRREAGEPPNVLAICRKSPARVRSKYEVSRHAGTG